MMVSVGESTSQPTYLQRLVMQESAEPVPNRNGNHRESDKVECTPDGGTEVELYTDFTLPKDFSTYILILFYIIRYFAMDRQYRTSHV